MLLLAYSLYGRKAVQGTHLDILFCAVGAILFLTSGGICNILLHYLLGTYFSQHRKLNFCIQFRYLIP